MLTTASEEVIRHIPGFVSANIHVSADRTRVVNYGHWESENAHRYSVESVHARG